MRLHLTAILTVTLLSCTTICRAESKLSGIGIQLDIAKDGSVKIVNVFTGGPADQAGLKANEKILEVDSQSVLGLQVQVITQMIAGPKGTQVTLRVMDTRRNIRQVTVTRDELQLGALDANDFIGTFANRNTPNIIVHITRNENNQYHLQCEKEHWQGYGTVYFNTSLKTYHFKGYYQIDDVPEVSENMRGVVGYIRIDCSYQKYLQMMQSWNLEGFPGSKVTQKQLVKINPGE